MPKFKFGAEIIFCDEYGLEPNFVLDFVPKLTFGAEVTRAEHRSPQDAHVCAHIFQQPICGTITATIGTK